MTIYDLHVHTDSETEFKCSALRPLEPIGTHTVEIGNLFVFLDVKNLERLACVLNARLAEIAQSSDAA